MFDPDTTTQAAHRMEYADSRAVSDRVLQARRVYEADRERMRRKAFRDAQEAVWQSRIIGRLYLCVIVVAFVYAGAVAIAGMFR